MVFRDRFCWQGPWNRDAAEWHFGNAPACGSLFVTGPVREQALSAAATTARALFVTAHGDTCMRWCGDSESVTACVVRSALYLAAELAGNPSGKRWLPLGRDLGPNHWFSL
jgi:urease accessory protein